MSYEDRLKYGYDFSFSDKIQNAEKIKNTSSRYLNKLYETLKVGELFAITKPVGYLDAKSISHGKYRNSITDFINNAEMSLNRKYASQINRRGRGQFAYEELIFEKIRKEIKQNPTIRTTIKSIEKFNQLIFEAKTKDGKERPYDYRIVYYTFYNEETKIN